nr:carbohydrate ABC transporter permease [Paenibacillus allorhizoplanae]
MHNTFKDIPKEIRESAMVDGAGEWRTYFQILLPLAEPGAVALMVFTFMNIWNDFMLPYVLLDRLKIYDIHWPACVPGENATNYGLIFGGTLISMIPSIIVYLIFHKQFVEGMTSGSNK